MLEFVYRNSTENSYLCFPSLSDITNGGLQSSADEASGHANMTPATTIASGFGTSIEPHNEQADDTFGLTHSPPMEPYFDAATLRNVTALVGKSGNI